MESEPLAKACELAFAVARQGVEASPPIEPPVAMRSFLYVPQLPRRAMSVAQRVVDEDHEFRARVAAQATEGNVGRDGYLWLHRPSGWDSDPTFGRSDPAQLVAGQSVGNERTVLPDLSKHAGESVLDSMPATPAPSHHAAPSAAVAPVPPPAPPVTQAAAPGVVPPPPPPPPTVPNTVVGAAAPTTQVASSEAKASIEDELASLRGLVSRLAEERKSAAAPVAGLETEVEERRAESSALASQLTSANSDLQKARNERDRAMTDREGLLSRQAELESELRAMRAEVEQSRSAIEGVEAERSHTLTTLEQAHAELEAAQRRIESAAESEANVRTQLDAAVVERDTAWRDASALRIERDQLGDRVRVAEQARIDLEAQLDEVSGQWQELKVEIQTLADERQAVEIALDELAQTRETSAAERRLLFNELASQLGQVEAERDHLASQIDLIRARITGTRSALDMANHSLSGELEAAAAAADASVAAVGSLDSCLGGAHEQLATLGSAIDDEASRPRSSGATEPAMATDDGLADAATMIEPPQQPTPPLPGAVSGEVNIEGFLPDGVEVDTAGVRPEATLFGNPRDLAETHLFGEPSPASTVAEVQSNELVDDEAAADLVDHEPSTSIEVAVTDIEPVDHTTDPESVEPTNELVADANDLAETDAPIEESSPTELPPTEFSLTEFSPEGDPADRSEPTDEIGIDATHLADRSSADDDQALANVMASYGFGADDNPDDNPENDAWSDAERGNEFQQEPDTITSFDMADTTSFIDPDGATAVAAVDETIPDPAALDDSEARRIATTPDMVMLIDGDAAATMGWRDSAVADRRRYLLEKLDQVTGEYGPAVDVVFDPAVGGEDHMPAPTKVRRRLIQEGTTPGQKLSELVDTYPSHFPIAIVSDHEDLKEAMRLRSVDTLEVVQLLDLIVNLPEVN